MFLVMQYTADKQQRAALAFAQLILPKFRDFKYYNKMGLIMIEACDAYVYD